MSPGFLELLTVQQVRDFKEVRYLPVRRISMILQGLAGAVHPDNLEAGSLGAYDVELAAAHEHNLIWLKP